MKGMLQLNYEQEPLYKDSGAAFSFLSSRGDTRLSSGGDVRLLGGVGLYCGLFRVQLRVHSILGA